VQAYLTIFKKAHYNPGHRRHGGPTGTRFRQSRWWSPVCRGYVRTQWLVSAGEQFPERADGTGLPWPSMAGRLTVSMPSSRSLLGWTGVGAAVTRIHSIDNAALIKELQTMFSTRFRVPSSFHLNKFGANTQSLAYCSNGGGKLSSGVSIFCGGTKPEFPKTKNY